MADLIVGGETSPSDVSERVGRASAETLAEWQKMEGVRGSVDDFAPELQVSFAMCKDRDYRPGDKPGEDMFLVDKKTGLTGVFDGLGGEGGGDRASAKAAVEAPRRYEEALAEVRRMSGADLARATSEAIERQAALGHPSVRGALIAGGQKMWDAMPSALKPEALALYRSVDRLSDDVRQTSGMTTLTLGKTVALPGGRMFEVVVNVGDSGAFKVRADGSAYELTDEDSALDGVLSAGLLTPEEAKNPDHKVRVGPNKEVTVSYLRRAMHQALGGIVASPRLSVVEIRPGEKVVYATDGVRDIRAFETDGHFDPAKAAAKMFDSHERNPASALAEAAVDVERGEKDAWGIESARAEIAGTKPDVSKKPKQDEKTVLVKERLADVADLESTT